jgi:glutathione synthase/RimK-type ligase-like ATP-grasp enzyme
MILVAGGIADSVTELVCARLADCGYAYRLLDLGSYPINHGMAVCWKGGGPEGRISGSDWELDLDEISGVFVRFLGPEARLSAPDLSPATAAAVRAEADTVLMALFEDLTCPVVNRLGGGMSNNSKPYQALLLVHAGFQVPPTLVTSDPDAVRAFHSEHGELIYKSASGVRSIVRRLGPTHLARLHLLRNGPAQFQAFIPGHNVRVHTVGDKLFATRVTSEAVDYRYARRDGLSVEMEPAELPPAVARACLRIARELDLLHVGIDLKETPDGDWFCFEVNPCPGFVYYERQTGQPISLALAELLHRGNAAPPSRTEEASMN